MIPSLCLCLCFFFRSFFRVVLSERPLECDYRDRADDSQCEVDHPHKFRAFEVFDVSCFDLSLDAVVAETCDKKTGNEAVDRPCNEHRKGRKTHVGRNFILRSDRCDVFGESGRENEFADCEDEDLRDDYESVSLVKVVDSGDSKEPFARECKEKERKSRKGHTYDQKFYDVEFANEIHCKSKTDRDDERVERVYCTELEVSKHRSKVILRHDHRLVCENETDAESEAEEENEFLESFFFPDFSEDLERSLDFIAAFVIVLFFHVVFIDKERAEEADRTHYETEREDRKVAFNRTERVSETVAYRNTGKHSADVHDEVVKVETLTAVVLVREVAKSSVRDRYEHSCSERHNEKKSADRVLKDFSFHHTGENTHSETAQHKKNRREKERFLVADNVADRSYREHESGDEQEEVTLPCTCFVVAETYVVGEEHRKNDDYREIRKTVKELDGIDQPELFCETT